MFLRTKKSSVFRKLLYSFLVMLTIPMIVVALDFYRYTNMAKHNALKMHEATLGQYQHAIDERLLSIRLMAVDLSMDTALMRLLDPGQSETMERYNARQASDVLAQYKNNHTYIHGMYIYLLRNSQVISDRTVFSPHNERVVAIQEVNAGLLSDLTVAQNIYGEFRRYANADAPDSLYLLHALPLWSTQPIKAMLGIEINVDALLVSIDALKLGDGLVCLLDAQAQPLAFRGDLGLLDSHASLEDSFLTLNGMPYSISKVSSRIAGLTYVSIMPLQGYLQSLVDNRNLMVVMALLIGIVGMVNAVVLARKNYRPIGDLTRRLKKVYAHTTAEADAGENELHYITQAVNDTFAYASDMREQLEWHMPMIRDYTLRNIINGTARAMEQEVSGALKILGFVQGGKYRVMLMQIYDNPATSADEQGSISLLACDSAKRQLGSAGIACAYTQLEGQCSAFILQAQAQNTQRLSGVLVSIEAQLRTELMLSIRFALGRVEESLYSMDTSYLDARYLLDSRSMANDDIVLHDLTHQYDAGNSFYYPPQIEERLLSAIKAGDGCKARVLLDEVFHENLEIRKLNLEMMRCLMLDIANTLVKNAETLGLSMLEGEIAGNPIKEVGRMNNVDAMWHHLNHLIEEACHAIRAKTTTKKQALAASMAEYIRQHYDDPNICLTSVANVYALTPSYLSSLFKEVHGQTFLVYLNQTRIDQANLLLRETDRTILDIAAATGYSNSNVFIRNYKKLQGITPGEYRSEHRKK